MHEQSPYNDKTLGDESQAKGPADKKLLGARQDSAKEVRGDGWPRRRAQMLSQHKVGFNAGLATVSFVV